MTGMQKGEVLSGVEDAVREFNEGSREAGAQAPAEAPSHLTEDERVHVKSRLIALIDEVCDASGFSGTLVDKLNAVPAATCALVCLDGGAGAAAVAASIASRPRQTARRSRA